LIAAGPLALNVRFRAGLSNKTSTDARELPLESAQAGTRMKWSGPTSTSFVIGAAMLRWINHRVARLDLDDLTEAHDGEAVADPLRHRDVVGMDR